MGFFEKYQYQNCHFLGGNDAKTLFFHFGIMFKKFLVSLLLAIVPFSTTLESTIAYGAYETPIIQQKKSEIEVSTHGITIEGKYYTRAEFERLLQQAQRVVSRPPQ